MNSQSSSTLCIKKSAGEAGCKVNTNQNNSDSKKEHLKAEIKLLGKEKISTKIKTYEELKSFLG